MSISQAVATPGALLEEEESKESLIDIGYPLKLTEDHIKINVETELTEREMWALQNIWSNIRRRWRCYALELYIDFYTENHDLINRFRDRTTGKINSNIMSEHGITVFNIFPEIIENGLKNWTKTSNRIGSVTKCHVSHGISLDDLMLLADSIKKLILKKCDGRTSPTVEIAIDKLWQEFFNEHKTRELIEEDDVSDDFDD